jgi:type VI secretion system protein ImpA
VRVIVDEETAAAILAPIDDGVGVDGRVDEGEVGDLFRELRFQRKSIFRAELRAAMGEDPNDSDSWTWPTLAEVARDYLIETGKDLEPMAILIEATTRLDGLAGVERAITLMADLVELYWDQGLYPPEDEEDGVEARFQPLSGLSGGSGDKEGTLIMPLRRLVLGGDPVTGELRYIDRVTADAQFAASQSSTADNKAQLAQDAQQAFAAMEALARRLSGRAVRTAIERLTATEAAWRRAISFISERTKPRFPSASRVSDELRNMREWMEGLAKHAPDDGGDDSVEEAGAAAVGTMAGDVAGGGAAGGPMVLGKINNRADALRAVTAAAEYFERFEPHAPMGPTLREVDRRARMSLADLLEELIPDSDTRETFYWRSGIKPPQPVEATEDY